jgi:putative endonuclease
MGTPQGLGRWAEDQAAAHLRSRGWRIVARNWRFHHKEIDVVARRRGVVAFVEVKARTRPWGHPLDTIDARKRRDLAVAARGWVALRGRTGETYRFDAVTVIRDRDGIRLEHVEGAWQL